MKFAALHGLMYASFANWVQQRKRGRLMAHAVREGYPGPPQDDPAGGSGAPLQWWEGVVSEGSSGGSGPEPMAVAMQLHLPGRVRMEITAASDALKKIPEDHRVASGPKKARRPRLPEACPSSGKRTILRP
jgi:hypothetical protein